MMVNKNMDKETIIGLIDAAFSAGQKSYSPYSHFRVGAALMTQSGRVFTGTNVENRSYSGTVCAERVAVFKAVSVGECDFTALAVIGLDYGEFLPPCGICRQVISEFGKDITIIMAKKNRDYIVKNISELLPYDSLDDLKQDGR